MMVRMDSEGTSLDEVTKRRLDAEARGYAAQLLAGRPVRLWRTNNPRCRYLAHAIERERLAGLRRIASRVDHVEWVDAPNGVGYGRIGRPVRREPRKYVRPWPRDMDTDVDWCLWSNKRVRRHHQI